MKKFKIIPIICIILVAVTLSMCSTKDDKTVAPGIIPTQINNTVIDGTWRMALYSDDGYDHTTDYASYSFLFDETGVVTATSTAAQDGTWSTTTETGLTLMKLDFTQEGTETQLDSITKNWSIVTATSSKIEMKYVGEEELNTDFLTFEKN